MSELEQEFNFSKKNKKKAKVFRKPADNPK